jgi:hypothetical protein
MEIHNAFSGFKHQPTSIKVVTSLLPLASVAMKYHEKYGHHHHHHASLLTLSTKQGAGKKMGMYQ